MLGLTPAQLDTLTFHDFSALIHAHQLRSVDAEYTAHKQAFINQLVKQTEGTGKNTRPQFPTLKSFYDYEQELTKLTNPGKIKRKRQVQSQAANIALQYNQGGDN
jgi:hypothetical protein